MYRFLVFGVLALLTAVSMLKPDAAFTSSEIDCAENPINPNLLNDMDSFTTEQVEEKLKKYLLCNGAELLENQSEEHLNEVWEALRCVMQESGCSRFGNVIFGSPGVVAPGATDRGTSNNGTLVQCYCPTGGGLQGDTAANESEPPHSDSTSTEGSLGYAPCRCNCGGSNLDEADVPGFPQVSPEATPVIPTRLPGLPRGLSHAPFTALPDFCHSDYMSLVESSGEAYQDMEQLCADLNMTIYIP